MGSHSFVTNVEEEIIRCCVVSAAVAQPINQRVEVLDDGVTTMEKGYMEADKA
jgi:hypothetical protein